MSRQRDDDCGLLINERNYDHFDIPTNSPPTMLTIEPPSIYKAKT
ncbi:MAG: hypothetical protein U0840_21850 [Gemmataceae bacterium]